MASREDEGNKDMDKTIRHFWRQCHFSLCRFRYLGKDFVKEAKAGKIEFRVDKSGIIHNSIGKLSFEKDKIIENARTFVNAIVRAKPQASKGTYMKKVTIASTMGPGIKLDRTSISG